MLTADVVGVVMLLIVHDLRLLFDELLFKHICDSVRLKPVLGLEMYDVLVVVLVHRDLGRLLEAVGHQLPRLRHHVVPEYLSLLGLF